MSWILLGFITPLLVAIQTVPTYGLAASTLLLGLFLYVTNSLLIRHYVGRFDRTMLQDGTWEMTAGLGVVPKWVSALGLVSIGLVPGAALLALLLLIGVLP